MDDLVLTKEEQKAVETYTTALRLSSWEAFKLLKVRVANGKINLGWTHPRTLENNSEFTQWNQTWVTSEELTRMASMVGVR